MKDTMKLCALLLILPLAITGEGHCDAGDFKCNADTSSLLQKSIKIDESTLNLPEVNSLEVHNAMAERSYSQEDLSRNTKSEALSEKEKQKTEYDAEEEQDELEEDEEEEEEETGKEEKQHEDVEVEEDVDDDTEDEVDADDEKPLAQGSYHRIDLPLTSPFSSPLLGPFLDNCEGDIRQGRRRRACVNDAVASTAGMRRTEDEIALLRGIKRVNGAPLPMINLNVHFHLVPNFNITWTKPTLPGFVMDSWLTEKDLKELMDHPRGLNPSFADVNVTFTLTNISTHHCVGLGTCNSVPNPTRYGTFSPWCAKSIISEVNYRKSGHHNHAVVEAVYSQLPLSAMNESEFHVWWLPSTGRTSGGRNSGHPGRGYVEVAQWVDRGRPYRKTLAGLAETLRHEIGHALALSHSKKDQKLLVPDRIMAGKGSKKTECDVFGIRSIAMTGRPRCDNHKRCPEISTPFPASVANGVCFNHKKETKGEQMDGWKYTVEAIEKEITDVCATERRRRTPPPKCEPNTVHMCRRRSISTCGACNYVGPMCKPSTATPCRRRRWSKCELCRRRRWTAPTTTTTTTWPARCAPNTMQTCRRRSYFSCPACIPPLPETPGYSAEHRGYYCTVMKGNSALPISTNICDGTRDDCIEKGKALCDATPSCFGVAHHPGSWSKKRKGVKLCLSDTLKSKSDWSVVMKKNHDPPTTTTTTTTASFPATPGYSAEQVGYYCTKMKSNSAAPISKHICDGTKSDCYDKGKALCDKTPSCLGVAYHPGGWSKVHKGVKLCLSDMLKSKSDWNVVVKESSTWTETKKEISDNAVIDDEDENDKRFNS